MKLYLDDLRPVPAGWTLAKTAPEAIRLLESRLVTDLSLDHDLGCCHQCEADIPGMTECACNGNGYQVACWVEERAVLDPTFPIPTILVHSANPAGVRRIGQAIAVIDRIRQERNP